MKVFQINSFFSVGGPPRIVKGLYDTLLESGHECRVAAAREVPYDYMDTVMIGTRIGVYKNAVLSRLFDYEGFTAKNATKKLIKQIQEYDPDVIHLHNLHGYYINVEVLFDYLKKQDKPVIWTLHDCWALTGHCSYFDFIGCNKWKENGCFSCPQIKEYPSSFGWDNSKQNWKRKKQAFNGVKKLTIVTPSKWLAGVVKQSFLGEYPVFAVANGIDLEQFCPTKGNFREEHNLENKKIVLGVAQNWVKRKGLNDFFELKKRLDDSYQIILVGLTQQQINDLPDGIIGITRTNSVKELAEIYTTADVFVNPSVEETMGLTTAEALACGTPAIVYDKTAVPEVVDEKSGIVVKAGDIKALVEAIENINLKAEDCIARAKTYEKSRKYKEYIDIYLKSLQ